jgi:hypothetical protein
MSDILIGVIVFGLVFGAAIFGMFLGRESASSRAEGERARQSRNRVNFNQKSEVRHLTSNIGCLDSQSTNYDSRNDLRFADHVQHPIQKQGRPVPNRYRRKTKVDLQNQFIGAACNIKRWLRWLARQIKGKAPENSPPRGCGGLELAFCG